MKVKFLREAIRSSGADADDLNELVTLLAEIDDAEISELVVAIKIPVAKVAATLAKRRAAAEEADAVIASFVTELERTKLDNAAFEDVVDRIKKSKKVKLIDAVQIASRFLGEHRSFKSKPEVAKAILKRQIGDIRSSERKAQANDIF